MRPPGMQKAFTVGELSRLTSHFQLAESGFQRAVNGISRLAMARSRISCGLRSVATASFWWAWASIWSYCSFDCWSNWQASPPRPRRRDMLLTGMPSSWPPAATGALAPAQQTSASKAAFNLSLFIPGIPWGDFRQHHHGRKRQDEAHNKEPEPAGFRHYIPDRGIDERARHRGQAGKQGVLGGRVARIGGARHERHQRRRAQPQAGESFETEDGAQQQRIGAGARQPGEA